MTMDANNQVFDVKRTLTGYQSDIYYRSNVEYTFFCGDDSLSTIKGAVSFSDEAMHFPFNSCQLSFIRDDSLSCSRIIAVERPVRAGDDRIMELLLWGRQAALERLYEEIEDWFKKVEGKRDPADLLLDGFFDEILMPGDTSIRFVKKSDMAIQYSEERFPENIMYMDLDAESAEERSQSLKELRETYIERFDIAYSS